jgi:hypothetical protein
MANVRITTPIGGSPGTLQRDSAYVDPRAVLAYCSTVARRTAFGKPRVFPADNFALVRYVTDLLSESNVMTRIYSRNQSKTSTIK